MDPALALPEVDPASLAAMLVAGVVGWAYLVYGWKQRRLVAFLSGLGLSTYPFLIDGLGWLVLIGVVLIVLPFLIRR